MFLFAYLQTKIKWELSPRVYFGKLPEVRAYAI